MDSLFFYHSPENSLSGGGPLQWVNISFQPNISVASWPTDAGSKALANFAALEDATLVRRLRQGGASLCGSTRMSEFGFGLEGSRAGEAISRREADAELVLDLTGESRLAASRAACCGFKPSYGLVSRFGLVGLIPSMECCGLLSGSLETLREILKAMAGPDDRDFSLPEEENPDFSPRPVDPQTTTVGVLAETQGELNDHQKGAFNASVEDLNRAGFSVREVSLPEFSLFSLVHNIVGSVEASSCAGRYDSVRYGQRIPGARNWNEMYLLSRGAAFGPLVKSYLFQGAFFQFERYDAYENACRIRARLVKEMGGILSQVDFLVLPAASAASCGDPASITDLYARFSLTAFANVTGQPALYLPSATGEAQPGVQLVGPRLSDARLLDLGGHLLTMGKGGN